MGWSGRATRGRFSLDGAATAAPDLNLRGQRPADWPGTRSGAGCTAVQSTDGLESAALPSYAKLANRQAPPRRRLPDGTGSPVRGPRDSQVVFAGFAPRLPGEDAKNRCRLGDAVHVHVKFRPRRQEDREVELADGAVVADLVRSLGESLDATVTIRGGVPVAEDEPLANGDAVTLLSALSGG